MILKRYHIEIYCPDWARESILKFSDSLKDTKLVYSYHATRKIKGMKRIYKVAIKNLLESLEIWNELYLDYIFEFYANDKNEIKKICYRFPMKDIDNDVIIVVSSTGKLVTIYLNRDFDKHRSLDKEKNNYEKGEIKIESNNIIETVS